MKLVFGKANAKLKALEVKFGRKVFTFSTLSGYNCPGAKDCQSFAVMDENGKMHIEDGKHTVFRCFSASQEVLFPAVYKARKQNEALLVAAAKDKAAAVQSVLAQLPAKCGIMRVHVAGDFKTQSYFDVWMEVARQKPDMLFYAYTKSIPFWVKRLNSIPDNFVLTASIGGKYDSLALANGLRTATVVENQAEADRLGLPSDHDDSFASDPLKRGVNFALLLHGPQPKGRKRATYGYNRNGVKMGD